MPEFEYQLGFADPSTAAKLDKIVWRLPLPPPSFDHVNDKMQALTLMAIPLTRAVYSSAADLAGKIPWHHLGIGS